MSDQPYVTIDVLAKFFAVSASTIRVWIKDERIPSKCYIKIGTTYRFHLLATQDALLSYDERKELTAEERDRIATDLIASLDHAVERRESSFKPETIKEAEAKLQEKATGVPFIGTEEEIDEIEKLLNEGE